MPGGLHPPLSVLLSWTPNYVDPETRGSGIIVLVVVLLILSYILVSLRLWARFRLAKNAGIDDVLIIFNMVCCSQFFVIQFIGFSADLGKIPLTGLAISLCMAFKMYGFDRHVWDSPVGTLINSRKVNAATLVINSQLILAI
jgi:hypothetical protein